MPEISLNILEFIEHPDLINDKSLSMAQKTCLKSIYGLPLAPEEQEIYQRATGRQTYDAREQQEVTIITGRRSGKTTRIAATIVSSMWQKKMQRSWEKTVLLLELPVRFHLVRVWKG